MPPLVYSHTIYDIYITTVYLVDIAWDSASERLNVRYCRKSSHRLELTSWKPNFQEIPDPEPDQVLNPDPGMYPELFPESVPFSS